MPHRTILVVDDESLVVDLLASVLSISGFRVSTARCGEEALELLNRERFAFVLTDLEMGSVSGLDVTRKALALDENITVFMLSGSTDQAAVTAAYRAGVTSFLHKPVSLPELLELFTTWVTIKGAATASDHGGCQDFLHTGQEALHPETDTLVKPANRPETCKCQPGRTIS